MLDTPAGTPSQPHGCRGKGPTLYSGHWCFQARMSSRCVSWLCITVANPGGVFGWKGRQGGRLWLSLREFSVVQLSGDNGRVCTEEQSQQKPGSRGQPSRENVPRASHQTHLLVSAPTLTVRRTQLHASGRRAVHPTAEVGYMKPIRLQYFQYDRPVGTTPYHRS